MTVAGFSLAELRAAYAALQEGTFSTGSEPAAIIPADRAATSTLRPAVLGVVGVAGGVGATVVALAVAEALGASRLVEFSAPGLSGLAAASSAELGTRQGWIIGSRGGLQLQRRANQDAVMLAPSEADGLTVMDLGLWPEDLAGTEVGVLVAVAACSVPSVRRLEARLDQLQSSIEVVPVITTVAGRSLPKPVGGVLGPSLRRAAAAGRLVLVPECSGLRVGGVTAGPLPGRLQSAVGVIASCVKELS
ncbi:MULTISPECIES: hypothetical protein [Tessaracoccus]|uniref:hypothetical protein n=1 Tax=Tessaracoccus TaxID=72763 RepID=UPI00099DDD8F|nr:MULTISPECIES: hypothetical protein [Tessaracoccus]AQX16984.1 hypothetical protein BKM78_14460 [Tessaracoccus sp. T2.5-30]VEP41825.1 hypothetical protein TLA_TLA_02910 [Tessaracoccus lapidicaptus]